jgi:hypothetical protein
MREGLGEVSEHLAGLRVELLGEEPELVARRDGVVEDGPGLLEPSLTGQALGDPEGAG